jgi:hypothetical protein
LEIIIDEIQAELLGILNKEVGQNVEESGEANSLKSIPITKKDWQPLSKRKFHRMFPRQKLKDFNIDTINSMIQDLHKSKHMQVGWSR